jgi:hypothetical protein
MTGEKSRRLAGEAIEVTTRMVFFRYVILMLPKLYFTIPKFINVVKYIDG